MPELLKDRFHYGALKDLSMRFKEVYPPFKADEFVRDVMDQTWEALELKARTRQITIQLGRYLPADYKQALGLIDKVVEGIAGGVSRLYPHVPA